MMSNLAQRCRFSRDVVGSQGTVLGTCRVTISIAESTGASFDTFLWHQPDMQLPLTCSDYLQLTFIQNKEKQDREGMLVPFEQSGHTVPVLEKKS